MRYSIPCCPSELHKCLHGSLPVTGTDTVREVIYILWIELRGRLAAEFFINASYGSDADALLCNHVRMEDILHTPDITSAAIVTCQETIVYHDASPEALTIKTGVALGLLNAIPGEGLGIVYADAVRDPDSLFRFSLGTFRRGRLVPVLSRHTPVGQWQELGMLRADVTLTLGHSASPQALEGGVVRGECAEHRLSWPGEEAGHPVFIRALSADRAEVALDVSPDCPDGRQSRVLLLDD